MKTPRATTEELPLSPPPAYASACWTVESKPEIGEALLTVSVALPAPGGSFRAAAEIARVTGQKGVTLGHGILPLMDDTIGILHPKPTPAQEEWGAQCEAIIADYLMLLTHRALFGLKNKLWANVDDAALTDHLFILGPALPKYRGRICYTHFRQDKTVAILAPNVPLGRPPALSDLLWQEQPIPPLWHDCAARVWRKADEGKTAKTVADFELIIPTGDGMNGHKEGATDPVVSSTLWQQKARQVQQLLEADALPVRLGLWNNEEVVLPKGIAEAVLEAHLAPALAAAPARKVALITTHSLKEDAVNKMLQNVIKDVRVLRIPESRTAALCDLVFCETVEAMETERAELDPTASLARRELSPDRFNAALPRGLEQLRKKIGQYLFKR